LPLEWQRVRSYLRDYCEQRNQPGGDGLRWVLEEQNDCFVIRRAGFAVAGKTGVREEAVLQLCYAAGCWALSMPRANGGWQPYPPCPQVGSLSRLLEELEQAPLHVHW
jgi:hypothetical protein